MRHWWQLATRSWQVKPGRSAAAVISVALGVATVVTVTCFYESVRLAISDRVVGNWLGRAHLSIEHYMGHWGTVKQGLVSTLATVEGVEHITSRSKRQMNVVFRSAPTTGEGDETLASQTGRNPPAAGKPVVEPIDVIGIQPETEYVFRSLDGLGGRKLRPGDHWVAMLEADAAERWGLSIGDTITIAAVIGSVEHPFTIVGTYQTRRLAKFQRPTVIVPLKDLQSLRGEEGIVTVIDVMLRNPTDENLTATSEKIQEIVDSRGLSLEVSSAKTKLQQLKEAEHNTHLILLLVAIVAMLTSFFIILTTMGMGIVERIGTFGLMRCLGITRGQLAGIISLEIVPLGTLGTVLGIPLGLGLTYLGARWAPEYVGSLEISLWGLEVAVAGGFLTTIIVAVALAWRTGAVSPLAAANPHRNPPHAWWTVAAATVGVLLVTTHEWMIHSVPPPLWFHPIYAFTGLATLYGGYVLITPLLVAALAAAFAFVIGKVMGLPGKLARDPMYKATWRGAGVCWMLLVGLSLIVYIAVRSESVMAAWNFPAQLPETFVWSPDHVSPSLKPAVDALPGVVKSTMVVDVPCTIGRPPEPTDSASLLERMRGAMKAAAIQATFVAGDTDTFLGMAKMGFVQGNIDDVRRKLDQGGYVLIPPQAARAHNLKLGDRVEITIGWRTAEFEVAGVVESPAMDIAVNYFEAESYMMVAASGAVLGTLSDAREHFGLNEIAMFMTNIELTEQRTPDAFEPDKPPRITEPWMAEHLLEWFPAMKVEASELATVIPRLKAWLEARETADAKGESPVTASTYLSRDAYQTFNRYHRALREITPQWNALPPDQRWAAFREQAILRRIAEIMDRPDAVIASVRRLRESIMQDIRQAMALLTVIPGVALAVAAMGVANLMMVNVAHRGREIAIIRAVGGTRSQIVRLVLTEVVSLGCVGSVVGVVLGFHAVRTMNYLTESIVGIKPVFMVPWPQIWLGVALTTVASFLAGVIPARFASRNDIVSAMQVT